MKSPHIAWTDALGVLWNLRNPIVCAATQVEANDTPKHAAPTKLETVKKIELLSANVEFATFKRAPDAGIIVTTYAMLRFSGSRRLRSLEVSGDSIHLASLRSKAKNPHGPPWHWERPRVGATGPAERVSPYPGISRSREAERPDAIIRPPPTTTTADRLNRKWDLGKADSAAYSRTRRKLALICAGVDDTDAELYTLRSPKTFCPRPICR